MGVIAKRNSKKVLVRTDIATQKKSNAPKVVFHLKSSDELKANRSSAYEYIH